MPRDSGRTGTAGNKTGKKPVKLSTTGAQIHIRMKYPMIHLTGEGAGSVPKRGKKT